MQQSVSASASPELLRAPWWPQGWWKIVDMRIGMAVHCSTGFDAGFSPYQSTRLSRYNAGP
jgi:hypothetical protein